LNINEVEVYGGRLAHITWDGNSATTFGSDSYSKTGSNGWNHRVWDTTTEICVGCPISVVNFKLNMNGHGVYCGFANSNRAKSASGNWQANDYQINAHESGLMIGYSTSTTGGLTQTAIKSSMPSSNASSYRGINGPSPEFSLWLTSRGAVIYFDGNRIYGPFGRAPGNEEKFYFGCATHTSGDGIQDVYYTYKSDGSGAEEAVAIDMDSDDNFEEELLAELVDRLMSDN